VDKTRDAERRMLGAISGAPAFGRGPAPDGDYMPELNVLCSIADFSTESEQHDAG